MIQQEQRGWSARVERMVLIETPGVAEQYRNNLMANVNGDTIENVRRVTNGGKMLEIGNLAGIASDVLTVNGSNSGRANVIGGWGATRMRFQMVVEVTVMGSVSYTILSGYTDHAGFAVGLGGKVSIDGQMRLHFNDTVNTRTSVIRAASGGVVNQVNMGKCSQILTPAMMTVDEPAAPVTHGRMIGGPTKPLIETKGSVLRPTDVMSSMGLDGVTGPDCIDTSSSLGSSAFLSSYTNGNAASYLSRCLRGTKEATSATAFNAGYEDTLMSRFANQAAHLDDGDISDEQFLSDFIFHGNSEDASVSWHDLTSRYPELHDDNITAVQKMDMGDSIGIENQAHWGGANNETMSANKIKLTMPSVMLDSKCSGMCITMSNNGGVLVDSKLVRWDDGVEGRFESVSPVIQNVDVTQYLQLALQRFKTEIFDALSLRGGRALTIFVDYRLYGWTTVRVEVQNQGMHTYSIPSFMDAITTPLLAKTQQSLTSLSSSIKTMHDCIN